MASLPPFSFSLDYFSYILAVTLASLAMIIIGGWVKNRLMKGGLRFHFARKSRIRRKIFGFVLFIVSIFLLGWMSSKLQSAVYDSLKQSIATGITGFALALIIAWFLYDFLVWRKNQEE